MGIDTTGTRSRLGLRLIAMAGLVALLGGGIATGTAGADTNTGPNTTNVVVNGTTVTAIVTSTGGLSVIAVEYFIDSVGADGTGNPMTVSGSSTTATMPTLAIGSTHTIYVHGEDNASGPTSGVWGPTASTTFTVGTTKVTTNLGALTVALGSDGTYTSVLSPQDPYSPGDPYSPNDPYKLFASVKTKPVTTTLGYTRYTLSVPAGSLIFDTKAPSDPYNPTDPYKVLVTSLIPSNGVKYRARLNGFTTLFVPPNPI